MATWVRTGSKWAVVAASLAGGFCFGVGGVGLAEEPHAKRLIQSEVLHRKLPATVGSEAKEAADWVARRQAAAIDAGSADWGFWGDAPGKYNGWKNHSNRLIPVYTFNLPLDRYTGENSVYRSSEGLKKLYGRLPSDTLNPSAQYADQTDIYRMQRDAVDAGKRRVILIVFDGMDWISTWLAATYRAGEVGYVEGRGSGLVFQDYRGVATDFGYMVTSPHDAGEKVDVDAQRRLTDGASDFGGYNAALGGSAPWESPRDMLYLMGRSLASPHAFTDSSSSATSMTAGIKTFNGAVNVDAAGEKVETIAHRLQREGWAVGAVTSVPISHATPAASYAQNVSRDDYQDLTRDLLGLRSVSNRQTPLPGLDVLIGGGWGEIQLAAEEQGANFVPGNKYLADGDLAAIQTGDRPYAVAVRTGGVDGDAALRAARDEAIRDGTRLFGFFGAGGGHLPFRTADGDFQPVKDLKKPEKYSHADIAENPTLAEMATAALDVLSRDETGFWLMVEAGDVDWANHANNVDNSIGAVLSGDAAVEAVFEWIEANGGWEDTAVIVTADHGHYFNPANLSAFIPPSPERP